MNIDDDHKNRNGHVFMLTYLLKCSVFELFICSQSLNFSFSSQKLLVLFCSNINEKKAEHPSNVKQVLRRI